MPIIKNMEQEQTKIIFYRSKEESVLVDWSLGDQNLQMYLVEQGVCFRALKGEIWFIVVILSEKLSSEE